MTGQKHCDVEGCGAPCQRGRLMCKPCWFSVPGALRRAVNNAWRAVKAPAPLEAKLDALGTYGAARKAALSAAAAARL